MAKTDLSWSIPVMRLGYAGRGLVYLVVSGFSLYAIIRGGQAKGTSSALSQLESAPWGTVVLLAIFVGMVAFDTSGMAAEARFTSFSYDPT